MKKINYTWEEFDKGITKLAKELAPFVPFIKNIYGIPRGGLIPAVALAHRLDLPLLRDKSKVSDKTLIVDDISDSGKTLTKLVHEFDIYRTVTLFVDKKTKYEPSFYAVEKETDEWVVFPWETNKSSRRDNT